MSTENPCFPLLCLLQHCQAASWNLVLSIPPTQPESGCFGFGSPDFSQAILIILSVKMCSEGKGYGLISKLERIPEQ